MTTIDRSKDRVGTLPGGRKPGTPTAKTAKRGAGSIWRVGVPAELLEGSPLARRLVALSRSLHSLDRPIPSCELAARAGCHRATVGRVVRRDLVLVIERDRSGPGYAYRWQPDPDLSADAGPRRPVGWTPLAVVDATYAELLGLEAASGSEASAGEARAVAARYDGRLLAGTTIEGLALDAGLSERTYRAAEARLVAKGYLTRTGPKGRWSRRLAHPDGRLGVALRQAWKAATRRWARRSRPAVCGRYGALKRWNPDPSIGSRADSQGPLYTQCEPSAKAPKQPIEDLSRPPDPEVAASTKERAPPKRTVQVSDLEEGTGPDAERWRVLHPRSDWSGPDLDDVVRVARWAGIEAARAAALDVDHRIRSGRHPVRSPGAMTAALAGCYTAHRLGRRCRWAGNHDCGTGALAADRARRYDEDSGRWRQARTDYWTAPPPVATQDEAAPLDADYWRLQLVPYLQEQGADDATYEAWDVPAEYRPS